jgi:heptosyltransferase-1
MAASHWVALGQRLNTAGYQVLLPHGNAAELATSQAIAKALNGTAPDSAVVPPTAPAGRADAKNSRSAPA